MINHISLNGILRQVDEKNNIRYVEVVRSYKNEQGIYPSDFFKVMMWSRNVNNKLFSYKEGTLVSIDGRLENINQETVIVCESLMYIVSNEVYFNKKTT